MATLKEHQAAMVDLLANGSGIPASASRLAHAMHDLINVLYVAFPNLPQTKDEDWINGRETRLTITPDITLDIKDIIRAVEANSPGLNDKALSKREKALKIDSHAKWPAPAEQRVKELENTIRQLKANNANLKAQKEEAVRQLSSAMQEITDLENALRVMAIPEQAGCRKPDTQVCDNLWVVWPGGECPVSWSALVEVELRSDDFGCCTPERADFYRWNHDGSYDDIIRYRTVGVSK